MLLRLIGLSLAAAVFAATVACDESLSELAGPTPNLEPTFSSIQKNILDQSDSSGRLACISCHNGNPFVPMNLTAAVSYANLVGRASVLKAGAIRVVPGNPNGSYLIHKLEGGPAIVGDRMPRGTGPFLTSGQTLVIRRWIELGAPND